MWPSKVLFKTQHISFGVRSAHQKFQLRVRQCKKLVHKERWRAAQLDSLCNLKKKKRINKTPASSHHATCTKKRSLLESKKSSCPRRSFWCPCLECFLHLFWSSPHFFVSKKNPNFHFLLSFVASRGLKTRNFGRLFGLLFQLRLANEWGCQAILFHSLIFGLPLELALPSLKRLHWKAIFLQSRPHTGKWVRMFWQE